MPKCLTIAAVAFALSAAAGSAAAQGRLGRLDTRVGPSPTRPDPTQSLGNLTVTGQVTGGFAFRGRVPYAGANELRLQLPSETIDTFQRDAMSLERVRRGDLYGPQPYTPPSRATYMLRRSSQSPYAFDPVTGAVDTSGTGGVVILQPERSAMIRDDTFSPILSQENLARVVSRSDLSGITPAWEAPLSAVIPVDQDRPGASALFGMIQDTQRRRLAETLLDLETADDGRVEEPEPRGDETEVEPEATPDAAGQPTSAFADLIWKLSGPDDQTPRPSDLRPGATPPSGSLEQLDTDPSARLQGRRAAAALAGGLGRSVVVRHLAGTGGDLFNRYMAQGDTLLRAGRFYQAASAYDRAQLIHEYNPLAPLGAGLAYFAAGESHRASFLLQRSVRLFPDLVRVRVDVDALAGAEVIDRRTAEIRGRLGETIEPGESPKVFLLTFIHANRGDLDEARRWAAELAPLVEGTPYLRDYVTAILADPQPAAPTDATATP